MVEFRYPGNIDAADEMGQWLVTHTNYEEGAWDSFYEVNTNDIIISIKDEEIAALFLLKFGGIIFKK